jgi:dimethylglycine dehydrogenase
MEVKAVREGIGVIETSGFAKYMITGEGAEKWLDIILSCKIPEIGRMTLAPMLKDDGKVIGDFTLARLANEKFFIVGSGIAEKYHMRWFTDHLPDGGGVHIKPMGMELLGVSIAGPESRDVLAKLTSESVSSDSFAFMDVREMKLHVAPAIIGRVSYTGDLGYEIWMASEHQCLVYDAIMEAGAEFGIKPFGGRALNALRLEKNFGSWASEFRPIYGPVECGLSRFVAYHKDTDFIGKQAALAEKKEGGKLRLRSFVVDAKDADVIGDEPIALNGNVVGWVTSGGYAHGSGVSVAMGYVPKEIADEREGWTVELLGDVLNATLQPQPLFDANASRMRS